MVVLLPLSAQKGVGWGSGVAATECTEQLIAKLGNLLQQHSVLTDLKANILALDRDHS